MQRISLALTVHVYTCTSTCACMCMYMYVHVYILHARLSITWISLYMLGGACFLYPISTPFKRRDTCMICVGHPIPSSFLGRGTNYTTIIPMRDCVIEWHPITRAFWLVTLYVHVISII